jgi:UPF0755 protein
MLNRLLDFWYDTSLVGKIVFFLGIFLFSLFMIWVIDYSNGRAVGDGSFVYELTIEPGAGYKKVSKELKDNHLIRSDSYFHFLLRMSGNSTKLKQGIYTLNDGMDSSKIMEVLVNGKVKMISFTIPEGYTNRQIGDVLTKRNIVPSRQFFLEASENPEFLKKYNIPAKSTEGYLYPETYTIPYNYKVEQIVEMMLKRFYKNLSTIPETKGLDPSELHQKVILASIVEREAKKKEEQPLMAGVFLKRLKIKMPLESCATVQYLFDKPKKRLLEKDLEIISPYNTYLNRGYPPGPISNPGLPAITAAFRPVESDNLFFLVKPDGSHYFSKTHNEHLEAKKKYIDVLYK